MSTHPLKPHLWKCSLWGITLWLSVCRMVFDRVHVLDRCLRTNMAKKAIVRSRGMIYFLSPWHPRAVLKIHSCYLTVWHEPVLTCLFTDSLICSFCFVVTSHVSLVLLYHNLTPTIIKGQDIELVDIWEQWWMWLALRQIPEQICDKAQQCLLFYAQNKLL